MDSSSCSKNLLPNSLTDKQNDLKHKRHVENAVIESIQRQGHSLNTVNNYRENIIHMCASNNCVEIIKEILRDREALKKADIKNQFGWTPLMQALRNRHLDAVKLLLGYGFSPNQRTYLGISTLTIATAMGKQAFETIFAAHPPAMYHTFSDDISPLCVAMMMHDRPLITRLMQLGAHIRNDNEYTNFMMSRSIHPDISKQAKPLDTQEFWNDCTDDIEISKEMMLDIEDQILNINLQSAEGEEIQEITVEDLFAKIPMIQIHSPETLQETTAFSFNPNVIQTLHISVNDDPKAEGSLISPNLSYNKNDTYCMSPNVCFKLPSEAEQQQHDEASEKALMLMKNTNDEFICNKSILRRKTSLKKSPIQIHTCTCAAMNKYKCYRPPKLIIYDQAKEVQSEEERNLNRTLSFSPEYNPPESPNAPEGANDEDAYGESTPTPPRCETPPTGIILTSLQTKLVRALKKYGLGRHIPLFFEQEVDLDIFLHLQDSDLQEIGIKSQAERLKLLAMINELNSIDDFNF